ncbi:MAG: dockerin type I repeat-containing protein [candidate division Zixibacteria bacterium]|nr:dockerin type I repeat-containing protein [candidate division Zixibacteria bacterium]
MNDYRLKVIGLVVVVLLAMSGTVTGGKESTSSPASTTVEQPSSKAGEQINWQVISGGGTSAATASYSLSGTVVQTAVGHSSSDNYAAYSGFFPSGGNDKCCIDITGNIDNDPSDEINIADLTYLVAYLFTGGPTPECLDEADVNGDGDINIADLTHLVAYLFTGGPEPAPCY